MGEVIFITSGKGGVGKTTVTANIGNELARSDKKVILLDFDFGLRNLDIIMGLEQAVVYDIEDVLQGQCRLGQALLHPWRELPLYFLPAAASADFVPEEKRFSRFMSRLTEAFDYVLIDSPAGISSLYSQLLPHLTRMILVVTSDSASISDASFLLRELPWETENSRCLVLNRFPSGFFQPRHLLDEKDLRLFFQMPVLGTIYEDKRAGECTNYGQLISDRSTQAGRSFSRIAQRILEESLINQG